MKKRTGDPWIAASDYGRYCRKTRTTEARDKRRGIPQGSPISPLLANLYMRRFVLGWKKLGLEQQPRLAHRELRRRPRDLVPEKQRR